MCCVKVQPCGEVEGNAILRAGGEGGIRTRDTLASMPHFECGAFNHSATSPECRAVAGGL